MDILKARKKAKEAKNQTQPPGAAAPAPAPAEQNPSQPPAPAGARGQTQVPQPAAPSSSTQLAQPAPAALGHEPSAPAGAPLGNLNDTVIERAPRRERERVDPLQEFLAVYDDGEIAHAVDFSQEGPALDDEKRFLSFDLAGEPYAASIMEIREILKFVSLTEVPRAPKEVLGVLSKRGVVMPVVDLAAVLGLRAPDKTVDRDQRVLVAGDGDRVCGLRVDRVREVVRIGQRGIEDVPASLGGKSSHMLLGLGRVSAGAGDVGVRTQMLILLDIPAVLAHFAEAMGIQALTREAS